MQRFLQAVVPGLLAILAGASCYADQLPPPAFRFSCEADADCEEGQSCIDGLCQFACTVNTYNADCPSGQGFQACFNGVCSHLCDTEDAGCPPPQECIALEIPDDSGGGGGQDPFGGGGLPEDASFGICGVLCSGNDDCPEGEACLFGACVPIETGTGTGTGDDGGTTDDGGTDTGGTTG